MNTFTVADYLIERLKQLKVSHVFSVPGTACADFILAVERTGSIDNVGTANELEAGYAADGYARVRGVGAVCVTYGVGTLSLVNAVAGALVEKCRLVVINGGPNPRELWVEQNMGVLFSHSTGRGQTDYEIMQRVTAAAEVITSAAQAPEQIDAALLACVTHSQPVYIEIANNLWNKPCSSPRGTLEPIPAEIDESAMNEAVNETIAKLRSARLPVIWIGEELQRFGLEDKSLELIEQTGLPFAATLLGKAILPEEHPNFIGVYDSDLAPKVTRDILENSDCILALGTILSVDHTFLVTKSYGNIILSSSDLFRFGYKTFSRVPLAAFLDALLRRVTDEKAADSTFKLAQIPEEFQTRLSLDASYSKRRFASMSPGGEQHFAERAEHEINEQPDTRKITYESFFRSLDDFIDEKMLVLVDTCLGAYPGADLKIKRRFGFIAQPVWLSIGYAVGATLGAGCALEKGERAVAVVGDGCFQMVAQAFSTIARNKQPAVMFVINNGLYGIEQFLIDPQFYKDESAEPLFFNQLAVWQYARLPEVFGGGWGCAVETMRELDAALERANSSEEGPALIEVRISAKDLPPENRAFIEA